MKYSVLDLFAGCGGFAEGFKMNKHFDIKLANDIWEPAMNTYKYNNPNTSFILDDIKNINSNIIEKYFPSGVDVIIGGPPCQGFSMCGMRDTTDHRNDLFYEYARIVSLTKPLVFVMENVKGLLSMKNKNGQSILNEIHKEFDSIGYNIQHKVLNTKHYEVPQARERVIFVGVRKDIEQSYKYPEPILQEKFITVGDVLSDLPNKDSINGELEYLNTKSSFTCNYLNTTDSIYNHEIPNHSDKVSHRMGYVPQGGNWQNIPEEFRVGGIHSNAYRRLEMNEPSITIKHAYKSMIIHPLYNRCLSIREVARIQSFKDSFIFKDTKTSQYQQLANAVPPIFAYHIANSVYDYLSQITKSDFGNVVIENKNNNKTEQLNIFEDLIAK